MKKFIAILIVILLISVAFVGCKDADSKDDGKKDDMKDETVQMDDDPVTITFLLMENNSEWPHASTPNFKRLQDKIKKYFNVDWQLQTIVGTSAEYETNIVTMLSAGGKLPDMIDHAFKIGKLVDIYDSGNGKIVALNDLIDNHAPDFRALLDSHPYMQIANSDSEGNILRIPDQHVENPQHRFRILNMRNDWIEKIGLTYDDITTTDDFYDALKAFQDQDVNGNGKKDEVFLPYSIGNLNRVLFPAFGGKYMTTADVSWYADADNKVYHTMVTDNAKEYLTYVAMLTAEGLMADDFTNLTGEERNERKLGNQIAAIDGPWWEGVLYNTDVRAKADPEAELIGMSPPLVAEGYETGVHFRDLPGYGGLMFTVDNVDPIATMKVVNWGYTLEGSQQNYYGTTTAEGGNELYEPATAPEGMVFPDYQMQPTDAYQAAMEAEPLLWSKEGMNKTTTTKVLIGNADVIAFEFSTAFPFAALASDIDFNL